MLGLVRGDTNTVPLGAAIAILLWVVPTGLQLALGHAHEVFSLLVLGAHVRLLAAIPLFFLCESWLDPRLTAFVQFLVRAGIVPEAAVPTLASDIASSTRLRDSWLAEALCLAAAALLPLFARSLHMVGATAVNDPARIMSEAGRWSWVVGLTCFRFLMFRWLWRLGLWTHFLWRVSRLGLHLVPTHPDGVAGLGGLEVVHAMFTPLIAALSLVQASSLAEEILAGTMTFEAAYPVVAMTVAIDAALFLGPLFLFAPKLWDCQVKGLGDYMAFAARYVSEFDAKWLRAGGEGESPLGTSDLQSLADLGNSVNVVRNMRIAPVSPRLVARLGAAALVPMLPLLLLKFPMVELVEKFLARLSGL
jgi:hypothetical protein